MLFAHMLRDFDHDQPTKSVCFKILVSQYPVKNHKIVHLVYTRYLSRYKKRNAKRGFGGIA